MTSTARNLLGILVAAAAIFAATDAFAGTHVKIKLKDGTVMEGELVEETDDGVTIKVAGRKLTVDKADIASMVKDEPAVPPAGGAEEPGDDPPAGGAAKPGTDPAAEPEEDKPLPEKVKARMDKLFKELPKGVDATSNSEGDPGVAAAGALAKIEGKPATRYMLGEFRKATGRAKLLLAGILADRKVAEAVPVIITAIDQQGVQKVPPKLIKILAKFRSDESTGFLLKILPKQKRAPDVVKVLNALDSTNDLRVVPAIMAYLEHPDAKARGTARVSLIKFAGMLKKLEKPPYDIIGVLLKRLPNSKYPGSYAVIFAYAGGPRTDAALLKILSINNQQSMNLSIFAVGVRRLTSATPRLFEILLSTDKNAWQNRLAAVVAIHKIGNTAGVTDLINAAAAEKNPKVSRRIYLTLRAFTRKATIPNSAVAWRKWYDAGGSDEIPSAPSATPAARGTPTPGGGAARPPAVVPGGESGPGGAPGGVLAP